MITNSTIPPLVKVLLPLGIAIAMTLGGASWRVSLSNEHRLTVMEEQQTRLVDIDIRQRRMEESLGRLSESMARVEGAIGERNRNEGLSLRSSK